MADADPNLPSASLERMLRLADELLHAPEDVDRVRELALIARTLASGPQGAREAYLRALIENAHDAVTVLGPDGTIRDQSPALLRQLGYRAADRRGHAAFEFMHPEDRPRVQALFAEVVGTPRAVRTVEFRTRHADGSWRIVESTAANLLDDPHVAGVVVNSRDVTDRHRAARELHESEGRFRLLVDTLQDHAVVMLDPAGYVVTWNAGAERIHGFRAEAIIGRHVSVLYPPDEVRTSRENLVRAQETGRAESEGWRMRSDGSRFWASVVTNPIRDEAGHLVGFAKVTRDLSLRREAEEALRESEQRFRTVFDHAPVGIALSDAEGRTLEVNPALQAMLGYTAEELRSLPAGHPSHPDDVEESRALFEALRRGERDAYQVEKRYLHRDGRVVWTRLAVMLVRDGRGEPRYVFVMVDDLTEQRRTEAELRGRDDELRQALKMEAVGRLAGGIAHDFNNILMAVGGHTKLLLGRTPESDPAHWSLVEIDKGANRAGELIRHLLAFSRKQVLQPRRLLLDDVVRGMEGMLTRLIGADVELVIRTGDGALPVFADPTQLEQVLLNLVVNSRDAMPWGGVIVIETSDVVVGPDDLAGRPGLVPGPYVSLCVTDTGSGIPAEVLPRIFEPFFTTRSDRGTGLGLSTVYGIAKQSGGYVYARSSPGRATTFELFLPPAGEALPAAAAPVEAPARAPAGGSETILLAEDDVGVRLLMHAVLRNAGYHVLPAADGVAALRAAESHPGPIHLLLTDVVMPAMSGSELAQQLRTTRPDTPVIYMSGYTEDRAVVAGLDAEAGTFVQKPVQPEVIVRLVRELLDQAGGRGA